MEIVATVALIVLGAAVGEGINEFFFLPWLDLSNWLHARYWKIRTGTSASPTVQAGADAVITVGLRQV